MVPVDGVKEIGILTERSSAWIERRVRDAEVAGSNPVAPSRKALRNKGFSLRRGKHAKR